MGINIRKATENDYTQVDEIYVELSELHYKMKPNRLKGPGHFGRPELKFKELIKNPESTILVAVKGDKVIGFADLIIKDSPGNELINAKTHVEVDNFGVRNGHQGEGIGKLLMKEASVWAKEKDIKTLEVGARYANKKAVGFYEKVGYEIISVRLRKKLEESMND